MGVVEADLRKAARINQEGFTPPAPRLLLEPTAAEIEAWCGRMRMERRRIAVDVETDSIHIPGARLLCIGMSNGESAICVPWIDPRSDRQRTEGRVALAVRTLLGDEAVPKVLQNGQFDQAVLETHEITLRGFDFDTMLAHHVVWPEHPHDLGHLASIYTDLPPWKGMVTQAGGMLHAPWPVVARYNALDAYATALCHEPLEREVRGVSNGVALFEQAMAIQDVLRRMKLVGLPVSELARRVWGGKLRREIVRYAAAMQSVTVAARIEKFLPGSLPQVHRILFDHFRLPVLATTPTGRPRVQEDDLVMLQNVAARLNTEAAAFIGALLAWRSAGKLLSTYVEGMPVLADGRVHPTFSLGPVTGRLSSSDPNAQNIPLDLRTIFHAELGWEFVAGDYSQLELRIIAFLSGDTGMLEAFRRGEDIHRMNAAAIFCVSPEQVTKKMRLCAKRFVYALNYGAEVKGVLATVARDVPDITRAEVVKMLDNWWAGRPGLVAYRKGLLEAVQRGRFPQSPLMGRTRPFLTGRSPFGLPPAPEILNYPISSGAADVANDAILRLDAALRGRRDIRLLAQVHDSFLLEARSGWPVRDARKILEDCMSAPMGPEGWMFPVDVKVGRDWKVVS